MKPRLAARLLAAFLLLGLTCESNEGPGGADLNSHRSGALSERLQQSVTREGIREHIVAFQEIADANNGTRASGTLGFDESADYVAGRLRAAGYDVAQQEFMFPAWSENSRPSLRFEGGRRFKEGDEYIAMLFSGGAEAEGAVTPIDLDLSVLEPSSGCEDTDFDDFTGGIALMLRSECFFRDQAANAQKAGAFGALIMPTKADAKKGVLRGTLTPDASIGIPVMGLSYSVGRRLLSAASKNASIRMEVDATIEERPTSNVLAEAEWGQEGRVVMLGGHLDSVPAGPGINDNGSGTATILEIAEELAELDAPTRARIRFAFWGAEEFGLLGSIHYVESLGEEEVRALDAYLNFDMLGSSNYVRFVYDGRQAGSSNSEGSLEIQQIFEDHFEDEDLPTKLVPLEDRSDHAIFAANGIAVGGLFSGADEVKTPEEVRVYGGLPRELHDPCYHLPCDTIDRVNFEILDQMADAAVDALATLAARGR